MPDIILELATVIAKAKALRDQGKPDHITITIEEAEQLLALWRNGQDDGK